MADNGSNLSKSRLYSQFLNSSRTITVHQGQPTNLAISNITFTTAYISYSSVGNPSRYTIDLLEVTTDVVVKTFMVDPVMFIKNGYYKVTGLTPGTVYNVMLRANYVSGDVFTVNNPKSFCTKVAIGPITVYTVKNPRDMSYSIYTQDQQKTSFTIYFETVNDMNDGYLVSISGGQQISSRFDRKENFSYSMDVSGCHFNALYEIVINTLYDDYMYAVKTQHTTLNEGGLSYFASTRYIKNTFVDLSYTLVGVGGVAYNLYFSGLKTQTDISYTGNFNIKDLIRDTSYNNTYLSVTYPITGNEYNNHIQDISFHTLNQVGSEISSTLYKTTNTTIDISYSSPPGSGTLYFYKDQNVNEKEDGKTTSFSAGSHTFSGLSIDTSYDITIKTVYDTTTHEEYTNTLSIKTINEGPIKLTDKDWLTHPDIHKTKISFSPPPIADLSSSTYYYYDDDEKDVSWGNIAFGASFVIFNDLSANTHYTISFEAVYLNSRSYVLDLSFQTINAESYFRDSSVNLISNKGDSITILMTNGKYYSNIDICYCDATSTIGSYTFIPNTTWTTNIESTQTYTIESLVRDLSYTIYVHPTLDSQVYSYSSLTQRTLNEGVADISNINISNNSATVTWKYSEDISYILVDNAIIIYDFRYTVSGIDPNTVTDISYTTYYYYSNNSYTADISFTTLHESIPTYEINTYFKSPLHGNTTIIDVHQIGNEPNTVINISGGASYNTSYLDFSMITPYTNYSGNIVTTYPLLAATSSGKITYDSKEYICEFSFSAVMVKPMFTVYSDSIQMEWFDTSLVVDKYTIQVQNGEKKELSRTVMSYTISGLDVNSLYDISFTRDFSGGTTTTEFQRIRTLYQGNVDMTNIVVPISGKRIVLDIINTNKSDVSANQILLDGEIKGTTSQGSAIFYMDVSETDTSYNLQVKTTYNEITDQTILNVIYNEQIYDSDIITFSVRSDVIPKSIIQNGKFDTIDNYFAEGRGFVQAMPDSWTGSSVVLSKNNYPPPTISYPTKILNIRNISISNNVILFEPMEQITLPNLSQIITTTLYQDFYKLSYYVANHVIAGMPFNYLLSCEQIEYQIKMLSDTDEVLFETSPIMSVDTSWNKIEIIVYFTNNSVKNVTLVLQRNKFQLNNLFVSNISIINIGDDFVVNPIVVLGYYDLWGLPDIANKTTWEGIMPSDPDSSGNVFILSSSMSFGFWLYIHDRMAEEENGIFKLGSGHPSIYIHKNRLYIKNDADIVLSSTTGLVDKIPIHYLVTFNQNEVSLYVNGTLDCSCSYLNYITEALPTDSVSIGTTTTSKNKYILNDMKIYGVPLNSTRVLKEHSVNKYSNPGNYNDLSGSLVTVVMGSSSTGIYESIDFSLNNGLSFSNQIFMYDLSRAAADVLQQNIPLSSNSFSVAFWGDSIIGNIHLKNANGTSVFTIIGNATCMYTSMDETLKIPTRPASFLQHYCWTFDISGYTRSYLNGYLYDISLSTPYPNWPTDCSSVSFSQDISGQLGDLVFFKKSASQSDVLTSSFHYDLYNLYDLSGFYKVYFQIPDVSYSILGNSYPLLIPTKGSTTGSNKTEISMSPYDLNKFNRLGDAMYYTIDTTQLTTSIDGSGRPYIFVSLSGGENDSSQYINTIYDNSVVSITLKNTVADVAYSYEIGGTVDMSFVDMPSSAKIIIGGANIQIKMKEYYKKVDWKTLTFSIAALGLAVSMDVSDTTTSMLSVSGGVENFYYGDVIYLSLTIPSDKSEFTTMNDFSLGIIQTSSVNYFGASSLYTFHRTSNTTYKIDLSFTVITEATSKTITFKLEENASAVTVYLNDIARPVLTIVDPSNGSVVQGGNVQVQLTTPISLGDSNLSFEIVSVISPLIKSKMVTSSDPSCDYTSYPSMIGIFHVTGANATNIFNIEPNMIYSHGVEKINFCLTDVLYSDISASIYIVGTAKQPSYAWYLTDSFGNNITNINEGESFHVILRSYGTGRPVDISYTITGIEEVVLMGSDTSLKGVFSSDSPLQRTLTVREDLTINQVGRFITFTTEVGDPTTTAEVSATININDTSQAPSFTLSADTTYNIRKNTSFIITLTVTNYTLLTKAQQAQQYKYTGIFKVNEQEVVNVGYLDENTKTNGIIVLNAGTSGVSTMTFKFPFTCATNDKVTFVFNFSDLLLNTTYLNP